MCEQRGAADCVAPGSKVLILSSRFGMGHMSCAQALQEMILQDDPESSVEIVDFMEAFMPQYSRLVYRTFNSLVSRHSDMYNRLNVMCRYFSMAPLRNSVGRRVRRIMDDCDPDLVICDTPMCGNYLSDYKRNTSSDVPLYVYVTDVTFHPEWLAKRADLYFVGDQSTRDEIVAKGVNSANIHVTGVPVSERFLEPVGCHDERRLILVMGGGLGLLNGQEALLDMLEAAGCDDVVLICGKNEELEQWARARYQHIQVLGFTRDIPDLMARARLIITKPGGITTFEAIKSQTPMLVVNPTLEQELGNARFIEEAGIGRVVDDPKALDAAELMTFINDFELLAAMRRNMRELSAGFEDPSPMTYLKAAV